VATVAIWYRCQIKIPGAAHAQSGSSEGRSVNISKELRLKRILKNK